MKTCENCAEWNGIKGKDEYDDCIELDRRTARNESCEKFRFNPSEFCGICGGDIEETEHSGMICKNNSDHYASQWDNEWHDFTV